MSARKRPLVSFVVPTLNRGRYVVRAVDSCLNADTESAGVDVEVIVLDSESDDGSWEALQQRFASDDRVTLAQNRRGLGPTKSWIDGARLARGDFVTFLWSDDFISPQFLTVLVPGLQSGAAVSVGRGLVRDLDDETQLPLSPSVSGAFVPAGDFLDGYFRRSRLEDEIRPVSPACCLFSREAFLVWINIAEAWCRETPLRRNLLWRRAIGPDLMLFFVAIGLTKGGVLVSPVVTAQFSHHPDSFSVAASFWSYETGYWLARVWYPCCNPPKDAASESDFVLQAARVISYGLFLSLQSLSRGTWQSVVDSAAIISEIGLVWTTAMSHGQTTRVVKQTAFELFGILFRIIRRAGDRIGKFALSNRSPAGLRESIERNPET